MTTRYLQRFFDPNSIAVIGASDRHPSLGAVVVTNLIKAGYPGKLMVVNRHGGKQILGVERFASVADLPEVPDLAVVCTAPGTVPQLVDELGQKSVRAVMIVMGGMSIPASQSVQGVLAKAVSLAHDMLGLRLESGKSLKQATWESAEPYDLRIMGPNCIGAVVPGKKLNASYAHCMVPKGQVAYVGQSGMLALAVVDWVKGRDLGISHLTTVGDSLDIDLADVVEYLADDLGTRAIVLQIERVQFGRRFVSALRAAARNKIVVVMKSCRVAECQEPKEPVARGLANSDVVYDAVLRRAGALRVNRSEELFHALETLTHMRRLRGEHLAIVCNGIGPALVAVDHLVVSGGRLAQLEAETMTALHEFLPSFCSVANPIDINADASPERFAKTLEIMQADPGISAILIVQIPTLVAPSAETASAIIPLVQGISKPVFTVWMGRSSALEARTLFDAVGIATFDTPEQAVDAFMYMVRYRHTQYQLSQVPQPAADGEDMDLRSVWALVGAVQNSGRKLLTAEESAQVLASVGVSVAASCFAQDIADLRSTTQNIAPPYAVKILYETRNQPFVRHSEKPPAWRGVVLNLGTVEEVEQAAHTLLAETGRNDPPIVTQGFRLQRMYAGLPSLQFSLGITRDTVFGPLVFCGPDGIADDVLGEREVGLPPLNSALAGLLVDSTAAGRALFDLSGEPARDRHALIQVLINLGRLAVEVPTIAGLEINPLIVRRDGILALGGKVELGDPVEPAIVPYPSELEETIELARSEQTVVLRPIRDQDAPAHAAFTGRLSAEAIRFRFFRPRSSFTRVELMQATQIDYAREMAFIATTVNTEGVDETLGVVRAWFDADNICAEVAVIVDDSMRGEGLGRRLLKKMIDYARKHGTLELRGSVLPDNKPMLRLATKLGFSRRFSPEDDAILIALKLNEPTDDWQRERLATQL